MWCYLCSKEILGEHYVVNDGRFAHESCGDPGHIVEIPCVSNAGRKAKETMKRLEGGYVVLSKQDINQIIEQSNRLPEASEFGTAEPDIGSSGQACPIQPDTTPTKPDASDDNDQRIGDEVGNREN